MTLSKLFRTSSFRISLAATGAIVLTALIIGAMLYWRTTALVTAEIAATVRAEVQGLREQYSLGGIELLATTIDERSRQPGSSLYYLADANSHKRAGNLSRIPAELAGAAEGDLFHYQSSAGAALEQHAAVGVSIQIPGGARLVVGRDVEAPRQFAREMQTTLLWGIAALSVVSLLAGLWTGRRLLAQVETITAASRAIMAGNLSERIPLAGHGDEMERLSTSLNTMLDRIEHLMNGLKEVSDNIAHDLKTPLNRLRQRADAALRDPNDATGHREALSQVIEEADDLIKTFNALLSIARLEAGGLTDPLLPLDLGSAVQDIAELYEPAAEEAGCRLDVATEPDLVIRANRQLIGQAAANLIDNAIKYSGGRESRDEVAPATITARVRRSGAHAEIVVSDHGPGIPEADRERALKRFVRLEASRSRPGTGLGLSLVAAVARLHGGDIRLEDNHPGLRVVILLPLHEAETRAIAHDRRSAAKPVDWKSAPAS